MVGVLLDRHSQVGGDCGEDAVFEDTFHYFGARVFSIGITKYWRSSSKHAWLRPITLV